MRQTEIVIIPIGWPMPTRYDIIGVGEDNKRTYLGYACCEGHARLAVALLVNSFYNRRFVPVVAKLFMQMRAKLNDKTVLHSEIDNIINKVLSVND